MPGRPRAVRLAPLLAVALFLAGCKTELHRGLTESEANEIVAVLLRAGIAATRTAEKPGAADKGGGTLTVSVDESRFADAVDLLRGHGLPRRSHAAVTDIFKGGGLVASPTEERARYMYALSEALAGTIAQIDGVLSARVHVVLPESDPLRRDSAPSSAAVFIRHAPQAAVGDVVPQIKTLVASSIPGLSYDKVSAVVVPAAEVRPDAASDAGAGAVVPVLGLWVHRDSARALQVAIGSGGALILALGGIAGWLAWRARDGLFGRAPGTGIALR